MALEKQMELFDMGGLMQEGGTIDEESGNEVPVGSLKEEVRDDIPAQLSEGEFVMPADVVRYHGLDKMMALRDEAKAGLQRMEDMGQMGNADEAVIPDGVPFGLEDLDMEDDGSPLEMQVGGFVQQPFGTVQAPATGFQTQQSAFANYVPQVAPLPTTTPVAYQAPVQQATPTMQTDALPTFEQSVVPSTVTYINDAGAEIQIPVDAQGNPLIPVPDGFRKKTETAVVDTIKPETPPAQAPVSAPVQQDEDDGPPAPAAPKTDQFGREEDPRITQVKQSEQFAEIAKDVDPRGFIEKIKDDFMGAVGASTTSQEYQKALDELAVGVANYTSDPEEQNKLMAEIRGNLDQPTRTELGMGLAPVTTGTTADLLAKIEESRKTTPETTRVETAQVTAEPATTVTEAAKPNMPESFGKDPVTGEELTLVNSAYQVLTGSNDPADRTRAVTEIATLAGNGYADATESQVNFAKMVYGDLVRNKVMTEDEIRIGDSIRDSASAVTTGTKTTDAIPTTTTRKTTVDAGLTGVQLGRGEDMPMSARIEKSRQSAQAKLDAAKKADRKQYSRDIRSGKYDDTFAQLDKARRDDNIQRNSKPNRVGVNLSEKVGKDKAAKIEDRQGTATNVDKNGQIYYDSSHDWSKSTQTNINQTTSSKGQAIAEDRDEGGTGKIVCTEMYRQTQLDDWAKAMKIWDVYQRKYLTPHHEVGYHWLFKPYVRGMQNSSILTQFGAFLARKRTLHLKHILTKGIAKDDIVGNIWCKIIHPIVYVAGKIQSWKK
jgi:hypothetical protein